MCRNARNWHDSVHQTKEEASSLVNAVSILLSVSVKVYWRSVAQKLELWRMVNEQPHKLQHTFSCTTLLLSEGVMQNAVTMAQVRVFTHMYMES